MYGKKGEGKRQTRKSKLSEPTEPQKDSGFESHSYI
jgi:hypothetical protein